MHRSDWQNLAKVRLREAKALASLGEWSGAYYLSGYALECALKSCVSKQFRAYTTPDKNIVQKAHTHNLAQLVALSGLDGVLTADMAVDSTFELYWAVAKDWSETSRYQIWVQTEAEEMLSAVSNSRHGVLRWVKKHW